VVVTLDDPPASIRPGLSTTARVTTATRENALSIPIQALTIRRKSDIEKAERRARGESTAQAASPTVSTSGRKGKDDELQGVFVIQNNQAHFRQVKTGITGVTDIEILDGLKENDRIITGSYKVLRELKHLARVRVKTDEEIEEEED
jgi:HlyD family secretion protein